MKKEYCILILSNGRPNNIRTLKTLKDRGYSGEWFIVCSSDDKTLDEYKKLYGERVIVFNKEDVKVDRFHNEPFKNIVVYARNVSWKIAEELGYEYFWQFDDDYSDFNFRFNENLEYDHYHCKRIDPILDNMFEFYKECPNIDTLCMAQGGDFMGGRNGSFGTKIFLKRKAMNSFLFSTKRPFEFIGFINEDVNAYVVAGVRGSLCLTTNFVALDQASTQTNKGGLTTAYLSFGTYVKSFNTVLAQPSSVIVFPMSSKNIRLHHLIKNNTTYPKILAEKWKK